MVSKHAEHAQPGMQRGRRAEKRNGRIAVGGVIAAQNDDIRVQAVDRADELVDPALRKPCALMNIGSEDDFQVFQVGRQVGYIQGVFLDGKRRRFPKRICQQHKRRQTPQNFLERKASALRPAIFIMIFGHSAPSLSSARI